MAQPLSPDQLADLRQRHVAFLEARLTGDAAKRDWRERIEAIYGAMLDTKVSSVFSPERIERSIDAVLAPPFVDGVVRPIGRAILKDLDPIVRGDAAPIGRLVPEGARHAFEGLLERPGILPPSIVREVMGHEAMEGVMRDVLFDALTAFNDGVNPFFAEWGLPGLIKKVVPFGGDRIVKTIEGLRTEFDKRLEPEIRKFLQGFAKKALAKAGDVVVAKGDEPAFLELRKATFRFVLSMPSSELFAGVDPSTFEAAEDAIVETVSFASAHADVRRELRKALANLSARFDDKSFRDAMKELGVTGGPDFDALADATWPWIEAAFATAPAKAWLATLTNEFYDGLSA